MEGPRDWKLGYSAKAISKIESAIAAYKKGTYTLSDTCKKYRIPEEHFRLCLEETNSQEAGNKRMKQGDVLMEGDLLELENVVKIKNLVGQEYVIEENAIEEEIVVEEEIIIEDSVKENEKNTEKNVHVKTKRPRYGSKNHPKWTEEEMHLALHSYTQKLCSYNEVCSTFGISKKEFKEHLLAYEQYRKEERKWETDEKYINFGIEDEQEDKMVAQEMISDIDQQEILSQIVKRVEAKVRKEEVGQNMFKKERRSKPRETNYKDNPARIKAEEKLATYIVNLQEGMFDPKALYIRKLAFQVFKHYNVDYKYSKNKQEIGKAWLPLFLEKNKQISIPLISRPILTQEYVLKKKNEYFEALENLYTKYNICASRIYKIEFSKFSNNIIFIYCANAMGVYISPMIILKESEEVNNLLQRPDLFDECLITLSPSSQFTSEMFETWLKFFIDHVNPAFDEKVILCLDGRSINCKSPTSLDLAHENGVILMQVPSCGTVKMQPIMMTFLREMHYHFSKEVESWCQTKFKASVPLEKSLEILLNIYKRSATTKNAIEGFQKVGIWPLNRSLFLGLLLEVPNGHRQMRVMEIEGEFELDLPVPENPLEELEGRSLLENTDGSIMNQEISIHELAEDETTKLRNQEIEMREMNSIEIEPREVDSIEVNATEIDSTEVQTTEINTIKVKPAEVDIAKSEDLQYQKIVRAEEEFLNNSRNTTNSGTNITPVTDGKKSNDVISTKSVEPSEVFPDFTSDISSVRFCKIHCTACDAHIGSAPSQITNMFEHPKLRTLLCLKCYEFYGDGVFEQGDDQTDMFCRWCANGGNLYCCSFCSNTFCSKCIKRNFDAVVAKKIEDDENWKCFVCDPTDLYPARSLCRAIIQHVQTVSRILQNDKLMKPAQIEEKLNFDESRCCIRKRKRKRRRTGSASEDDDDETYNPVLSEIPQAKRRRTRKSGAYPSIHTNGSINNQSDDDISLHGGENDLLPAILACEQTMTEGETALPFGPPPPPLQRVQPPPLVFTNNTKINPVPTVNLLKPIQLRKLTPVGSLSQAPRPMLVQKRPNRPMVSIPQPKPQPLSKSLPQVQVQQKRARVLLPKARSATSSGTPKIIDLDSDSDEAVEVITEATRSSPRNKRQDENENTEVDDMRNKTFEQLILDQKGDIDIALQALRKKFNTILSVSPNELQNNTHKSAASKMRQFQQVMRTAICKLAQINDRVVREYQIWKKQQSAERSENSERTKIDFQTTKDPEVDLEMKCVRDSASESEGEDETESEDTILEASNLEADQLDCYRNLTLFRKKVTVEQGVGSDSVLKEDKSVQVYDVRMRDYEKSVGYSLLMKAEYDPKTSKEVLKPVAVPNEHFGKFQEQYIYHLQHIEDNGIKTDDDMDDLPDPSDTPLKDLIEANSPFITEMLENIAPTVTNGSSSVEKEMIVDESPSDKENGSEEVSEDHQGDPTVATSKAVEELVKMVTKLSDELKSSNNSPENSALSPMEINDGTEETSKKKKTKSNEEPKDEETVIAVRTLIEEESSSSNDFSEPPGGTEAVETECNFLN